MLDPQRKRDAADALLVLRAQLHEEQAFGLMAVLIRQQQDNEGLRIAMVAMSIPGLFALLLGIVTTVLWSRRSQRLTLETLQDRLQRIEKLLRD